MCRRGVKGFGPGDCENCCRVRAGSRGAWRFWSGYTGEGKRCRGALSGRCAVLGLCCSGGKLWERETPSRVVVERRGKMLGRGFGKKESSMVMNGGGGGVAKWRSRGM